MNYSITDVFQILLITSIFFILSVGVQAAPPIKDASLGLSKTSVDDSPASEKFTYSTQFPGTSTVLPRAYSGAPPQIPHNIESFLPVSAKNNACKMCHHNPAMIGKKVKGQATAMPKSHYTDQRHAPGKVSTELVGARYVCTQCHVPQANVKPLVVNSFDK